MPFLNIKDFLSKSLCYGFERPVDLPNVKVVMCNESCDLDSVVSTIVYSYFLQSLDKDMEFGAVIPLLNMKKKDFVLKTEVKYFLNKYAITQDLLIFRDVFNLKEIADDGKLNLCLVDHNVLSPSDAFLDPFVISILDHHQLERTDTPVHGMTVEPVGSCCTLVTEQILEKNPDILDETSASLLYGTILLDTINLNEQAKRGTPKDVYMLECLETYLDFQPSIRQEIFMELTAAKMDISELSTEQILYKDMKLVSANNINIALSSVPLLDREFLLNEDIEESVNACLDSCVADILIIIGINLVGEVLRDLAIISHRKSHLKEVADHLVNAKDGVLELVPNETSVKDCLLFSQGNKTASRKVILPLIKQWAESRR